MSTEQRPLFARVLEHCTLRASRAARPSSPSDRAQLGQQLSDARASLDHARDAWNDGDGPAALIALSRAEARFSDAAGDRNSALSIAAAPYVTREASARSTIATFHDRWRALSAALDRVAICAAPSPLVAWVLVRRWSVLLVAIAALATSARSIIARRAQQTTASATWGITYLPEHVADHNLETSWLLPDGALGWVRTTFAQRELRSVRLFNVRRLPSYGAKLCTVEFERDGRAVRSELIDLSSTVGQSVPYVLRLPSPVRADAIRVTIRSYHGLGGGLGEIEVE